MEAKNKAILKKIGIVAALGILVVIFNQLTNNAFGSQRNLVMLLKQASVLMILTSSLMMLLIEKNFDLSGGSGVYLAGTICALMIVKSGISMYIAIPVTLVLGVFMGSINGFFIGYLGLPAFIVTLAAQQIFRGIGYTLTDCATVGPMPSEFTAISETFIPSYVAVGIVLVILVLFIVSNLKNYRKMGSWYGGKTKLIENIALAGSSSCNTWLDVYGLQRMSNGSCDCSTGCFFDPPDYDEDRLWASCLSDWWKCRGGKTCRNQDIKTDFSVLFV